MKQILYTHKSTTKPRHSITVALHHMYIL